MKTIYVVPATPPWLVTLNSPYDKELVAWVKQIPGAKWEPARRVWLFPCEMVSALRAWVAAAKPGWRVAGQTPDLRRNWPILDAGGMHPWQQAAVEVSVRWPAWLFNDEPGLGKSREVIEALKIRGAETVLVVCPAQARYVWHHPKRPGFGQLDKWWPAHPPVCVIEPGKKLAAAAIYVCSYEMLGKPLEELAGWVPDAVVFDEGHYLQDPRSERSQRAVGLVKAYPGAWRGMATGTAITNQPESICNPLNILFPGRYGSQFQFARRYSNATHNGYGWEFEGVNTANEAELRYRLGLVSSRATQADAAGLLPAFTVSPEFIKPRARISEGVRWAKDQLNLYSHVILLTHHIESAKLLAESLSDLAHLITGVDTPAERLATICKAREAKSAVLIASIHSIMVGINDLDWLPAVCVVESYSRPADMIQVLRRFPRLSSTVKSVNVTLLISEEGNDPAEAMARKIEQMNKVIKAGGSETALAAMAEELKSGGLSKEEIDAMLSGMAGSYKGDDDGII